MKTCTMYQLNPETVFFDDREDNIAGAGACGIHLHSVSEPRTGKKTRNVAEKRKRKVK